MNTPTITTRVADLVRNPDSAMPSRWEHSQPKPKVSPEIRDVQSTILSSGDTLTLSPLAMKILEDPNPTPSNWEKSRDEKVQRTQQLVQEKQYILSPEIIDNIAQKIVAMLP